MLVGRSAMRSLRSPLLAVVIPACASNPPAAPPAEVRPELLAGIASIEQFAREQIASASPDGDAVRVRIEALAATVELADLPGLAALARQEKWLSSPFPMHILMVLVGRYDVAVELLVPPLRRAPQPGYVMWKLTYTIYGKRADYEELRLGIARAWIDLHDRDPSSRDLVRKLFQDQIDVARKHLATRGR